MQRTYCTLPTFQTENSFPGCHLSTTTTPSSLGQNKNPQHETVSLQSITLSTAHLMYTSTSALKNYKHVIFTALIIQVVKKCHREFKPSATRPSVPGRVPSDVSSCKDFENESSGSTRQATVILNYTPVQNLKKNSHRIYGSCNELDKGKRRSSSSCY